ncbi:hypothetical protein AKO1_005971 [Acrasis kona]|uniref:Uncharacterized protein n=1 Tax=Acrasis kona TaxID=1008807 RepID=A0AAW2ZK31_9EUKA
MDPIMEELNRIHIQRQELMQRELDLKNKAAQLQAYKNHHQSDLSVTDKELDIYEDSSSGVATPTLNHNHAFKDRVRTYRVQDLRPQIPIEGHDNNHMVAYNEAYRRPGRYVQEDQPESREEHDMLSEASSDGFEYVNQEYHAPIGHAQPNYSNQNYNGVGEITHGSKKRLKSSLSMKEYRFQLALSIVKRFAIWYVDPGVKKRRDISHTQTASQLRQGVSLSPNSSKKQLLRRYIPTGDGLVMRRTNVQPLNLDQNSPQKLQRSWTDSDVKQSDLFEIEIYFDDFRHETMDHVLQKLRKHHKNIKRMFVTCPQGVNARGRRSFLLDMNQNVMPRMAQAIQELMRLVSEHGEERIKMPIYLWKGKDRRDKSITNSNMLEVLEYIKMYLANSAENHQQYIAENEYAEHVEEMLHEEDDAEKAKQDEMARREMQSLVNNTSLNTSQINWANQSSPNQKSNGHQDLIDNPDAGYTLNGSLNSQTSNSSSSSPSAASVRRAADIKRSPTTMSQETSIQ